METTSRKIPEPREKPAGKIRGMYGVVSTSTIIGEAVVNRQDEDLGKIAERVTGRPRVPKSSGRRAESTTRP